jgi:hypothetical protein
MSKKVLVNLDLTKNQILNAALHNVASHFSTTTAGQVYYNTTDKAIYFYDGTTPYNVSGWINISGDITEVVAGDGLTGGGSGGSVTLDLNPDDVTIEVDNDIVRIKDLGVSTGKIAALAVTTAKIGANQVTFAKIQQIANLRVIGNTSGDVADPSEIVVLTSTSLTGADNTNLATAGAIKSYVDSKIGGLGNLEGAWAADNTDGAGGTAIFPTGSTPVAGTKAGDYWYVSAAGTVDGEAFNVGDVIIAKVNSASTTDKTDWIRLEVNRDQATESALGLLEIATQAEVNTGTDDQRAVTPLKLKTLLDNRTGGYAANIGNGTDTAYTVTHSLNTIDVIVMLKDNTTLEEVLADVVITDVNNITVTFATVPANNAYRVIIKK